ncbi:MAG: glycosyltransferase family 2 protein [Gemmatimonadaceae bacterium]|nr:glycosyltransferase family 2 protein [Gemmatimonadaceae bacterium]
MHSEKPLATIITTVHDLRPYIGACIQSVLRQTYERWEQIIVDDGSTDGTEQIVRQFSDPRIKYIRLPKRGVPALAESYNTALASGRGNLVAVLEGDDFWPDDKLAVQVAAFDDSELQICWGESELVSSDGKLLSRWPRQSRRSNEFSLEELFRELTCTNILTPTVTVMLRREALDRVGGFRQPAGALYVDLPTWLIVSATAKGKARKLGHHLGYYRVHGGQISTEFRFDYFTSQSRVIAAILEEIDPSQLVRLGWDTKQMRIAETCASLARGTAYLRIGNRAEARKNFAVALSPFYKPRKSLRALLGYLSTFMRLDLLAAVDSLRLKFLTVNQARTSASR